MITSWFEAPPASVIDGILLVCLILVVVSLRVFWVRVYRPHKDMTEMVSRVQTFWVIVLLLAGSLCLHATAAIVFWGVVSYLALKEYFTIIPTRQIDRPVLFWAYLSIPVQYYWIVSGWYEMFVIFIPVYVYLFLPLRMVLRGETKGFLRAAGTLHWGVMMMVYCMSCIAALYMLYPSWGMRNHATELVFYLLFLNQLNDAAQFFWGKKWGKHKIAPTISPNKTVEGFLGGAATTVLCAIALAPYFTAMSVEHSFEVGLIIAFAGFFGDLIMSSLKRDLGIKDTGRLLPGHGGILDRIDSLLFVAPLYFHFMRYYYFPT